MNLGQDEIDRFEAKRVELERDDCWVWQGAKYQNGYGMVALRRGKRKTFSAHRIAWKTFRGRKLAEPCQWNSKNSKMADCSKLAVATEIFSPWQKLWAGR